MFALYNRGAGGGARGVRLPTALRPARQSRPCAPAGGRSCVAPRRETGRLSLFSKLLTGLDFEFDYSVIIITIIFMLIVICCVVDRLKLMF